MTISFFQLHTEQLKVDDGKHPPHTRRALPSSSTRWPRTCWPITIFHIVYNKEAKLRWTKVRLLFCVRRMNLVHTSGFISFLLCFSCLSPPPSTGDSGSSYATLKLFLADRSEIRETCKHVAGQRRASMGALVSRQMSNHLFAHSVIIRPPSGCSVPFSHPPPPSTTSSSSAHAIPISNS